MRTAEFINQHYPSERMSYDYIDSYCAGWFHHRRAGLAKVYALLFRRLQEQGCDWVYSFPRLQGIDLGKIQESEPPKHGSYDPGKAMQEELKRERKKQSDKLHRRLDEAYGEAREKAKLEPPPEIVAAYRKVYGKWPEG